MVGPALSAATVQRAARREQALINHIVEKCLERRLEVILFHGNEFDKCPGLYNTVHPHDLRMFPGEPCNVSPDKKVQQRITGISDPGNAEAVRSCNLFVGKICRGLWRKDARLPPSRRPKRVFCSSPAGGSGGGELLRSFSNVLF